MLGVGEAIFLFLFPLLFSSLFLALGGYLLFPILFWSFGFVFLLYFLFFGAISWNRLDNFHSVASSGETVASQRIRLNVKEARQVRCDGSVSEGYKAF